MAQQLSRRHFLRNAGMVSGVAALNLGLPGCGFAATGHVHHTSRAQQAAAPWFAHEFIADSLMNERLIWFLGHAWERMADVGEVLDVVTRIEPGNVASWRNAWYQTADRLYGIAAESQATGHPISAGETYLRAAGYYLAGLIYAEFPDEPDMQRAAEASATSFEQALVLLDIPGEPVDIPYADSALPAYFFRSPIAKGKAPVLIVHQGLDASVEEDFFMAEACLKRGYHCLLLHHPGQGLALRLNGLTFRNDWENVITPVVDWVIDQPGVDADRLALIGMSFGGALVTRAVAYEKRIKICIANPAVLSWADFFYSYLFGETPEMLDLLAADPVAFNVAFAQYLEQAPTMFTWWVNSAQWKFGASDPAELITMLGTYTNTDIAHLVECHMLIMDGESEWIAGGQAKMLYDQLTCPKDYMFFTTETTADMHCQTGAMALSAQRLFDWFDDHI